MTENQENFKPLFDISNVPNLLSMNMKNKVAKETGVPPVIKNDKGEVIKTDMQLSIEI